MLSRQLTGLRYPSRKRLFSTFIDKSNDFTHCVWAGVVGLAIARKLSEKPNTSTVLLERHGIIGSETSSRNSEVIHAGLYYPPNSLKTMLCIEGRSMMYEYCQSKHIPHRNCGKWIVAQTPEERESLTGVYEHALKHGIPMRWISAEEAKLREPNVRVECGALESSSTGIVDSHALMQSLLADFEENGGDLAINTVVQAIRLLEDGKGFGISTNDGEITADTVINAAGLGAVAINNLLLPEERHMTAYYCKGTYFSYSKKKPEVETLIYPAPRKGFGGLGTHLTMDMAGRLRFGPDVEWTENPHDLTPNPTRLAAALVAIKTYLPDIDESAIEPDYCGMRPKIRPQSEGGVGQVDFVIREENGYPGFINLLGIESPGLTSSLAIGKYVANIMYKG